MYKIKFYKDNRGNEPINNYLKELDKKAKTSKNDRINLKKIIEYITILKNYGTKSGEPYIKHISGEIWELRPLKNRIFFFYFKDNTFIFLHHFIKKTNKTPKKEIEQAKRNLNDVLERSKEYE